MSEYSDEIKDYYKEHCIRPGERAWFFNLTGHMMVEGRKKITAAMGKKVERLKGQKYPWEIFKLTVEHDAKNKHDDKACAVFLWNKDKDSGEWRKLQIGFVKRNNGKQALNHNLAVLHWLDTGDIIKTKYPVGDGSDKTFESPLVRLVHIYYNPTNSYVTAHFAVHTNYHAKRPENVAKIESVGISPEGHDLDPEIPDLGIFEYPSPRQVDKLISLHKWFVDAFRLEDGENVLEPAFLSQWWDEGVPVQNFESQDRFEEWLGELNDSPYDQPSVTHDLRVMAEEYGDVMAQNYYRLSGPFEGPVTSKRVLRIISTLNQIKALVDQFKAKDSK